MKSVPCNPAEFLSAPMTGPSIPHPALSAASPAGSTPPSITPASSAAPSPALGHGAPGPAQGGGGVDSGAKPELHVLVTAQAAG